MCFLKVFYNEFKAHPGLVHTQSLIGSATYLCPLCIIITVLLFQYQSLSLACHLHTKSPYRPIWFFIVIKNSPFQYCVVSQLISLRFSNIWQEMEHLKKCLTPNTGKVPLHIACSQSIVAAPNSFCIHSVCAIQNDQYNFQLVDMAYALV